MTKAFIANIRDDIMCGLSSDILDKYDANEKPEIILENIQFLNILDSWDLKMKKLIYATNHINNYVKCSPMDGI